MTEGQQQFGDSGGGGGEAGKVSLSYLAKLSLWTLYLPSYKQQVELSAIINDSAFPKNK